MKIFDEIRQENLAELLKKPGGNSYSDSDAKMYLALFCDFFDDMLKIIDGDITISISSGVLNAGICDFKTQEEFESIALSKHVTDIFEKPKVYSMKLGENNPNLYHILTSIGIISLRATDIYKLDVVNNCSQLNINYLFLISTFQGDTIRITFNLKSID